MPAARNAMGVGSITYVLIRINIPALAAIISRCRGLHFLLRWQVRAMRWRRGRGDAASGALPARPCCRGGVQNGHAPLLRCTSRLYFAIIARLKHNPL